MQQNMPPDGRLTTRLLSSSGCFALALLLVLVVVVYILIEVSPRSFTAVPVQPTRPAITCRTPAHQAGDATATISSGGLRRSMLIHLAPSYGKQPQPLVVVFHGYAWTSQIMEHNTGMDVEADKAGFVLVFPQGVDSPPSWNAGNGIYGPTGDADDVQFTRDLLDYMQKQYCIDAQRIYIAGFSLGGGMAYRLACTLTDRIAAVATVSGAYYPIPGGCQPARPLPVLEIHGEADTLAPYAGNPAADMGAVQDYLNGWLIRDRCEQTPSTFFQQGDVTGIQWTHCAAGTIVRHYRISDGGHTWPGTPHTTHVIDANVVIWDFFKGFTVPGSKKAS